MNILSLPTETIFTISFGIQDTRQEGVAFQEGERSSHSSIWEVILAP